jgi:hypothetical protein
MWMVWPYLGQQKQFMVGDKVNHGTEFRMTFSNNNKAKSKQEI